MNKITGIYRLISPSGKSYIGQSINIYARWAHHKREKRNWHRKLVNAIKKYGFDVFDKQILEECSEDLLDERERFWIGFFDSCNKGYNCDLGGQKNKIFSLSHRNKLRLASLGKYNGTQNIEFYIDEHKYFSIGEASKILKIPAKTIHNRLNSKNIKFSNYSYVDKNKNPIRSKISNKKKLKCSVNGMEFTSLAEAARHLKIRCSTIYKRIKAKKKWPEYVLL